MSAIANLGFQIPEILLPRPGIDLHKWAVIACDQFTSEPEYWQQVAELVGDAPSTFHLILPEIYLGTPEEARRVHSIRQTMQEYLARDLFVPYRGPILVERTVGSKTRYGLMLALDLEQYNYRQGASTLIRASEGTILERLPPRVRIRSGAPLELPHILVLIDDPERTVIEPLAATRHDLPRLYDTELMLGSGHVTGYLVAEEALIARMVAALKQLAQPEAFVRKYDLLPGSPVLLFAVGDGNHSLATAKAIWEELKAKRQASGRLDMEHPARYALVEIENIHDPGLTFEPIHRVLFEVKGDLVQALEGFYPGRWRKRPCAEAEEMMALVDQQAKGEHAVGLISRQGFEVLYIANPPSNLPVGTLQAFLDAWGQARGFNRIDYVHGQDAVMRLGQQPGNLGFYLPAFSKSDFFKTVIVDGVLPRKTFSMGEAKEKRFYMEARRIL